MKRGPLVVVLNSLSHRAHRGEEGPLVTGSAEINGLGLLRQGKDNVGRQGYQIDTTCGFNTSLGLNGIERPNLKKSLNHLISGFSFPLCALWLKTSVSQLTKDIFHVRGDITLVDKSHRNILRMSGLKIVYRS